MNKLCIVLLILGLALCGYSCSRSTEKSEADRSIEEYEEELNVMEREMIGEENMVEKEAMAPGEEMGEETETLDKGWGDEDESTPFE